VISGQLDELRSIDPVWWEWDAQGKLNGHASLQHLAKKVVMSAYVSKPHNDDSLSRLILLTESMFRESSMAIFLCRAWITIREKKLGSMHPECMSARNKLACMLSTTPTGWNEAETLYKQSAGSGDGLPAHPVALNNLASLLVKQGKLREAEPVYRKALQRTAETGGKSQAKWANTITKNLSDLLAKQNRDSKNKMMLSTV